MRYLSLSNDGGRRRWFINECPWHGSSRTWDFMKCKRIRTWRRPTYRGQATKVFEDFPWTVDGMHLVSKALKSFFEEEAPGHAQFLPVTMKGPGVGRTHRNYWLVNWLKRLDCLDESRSLNHYDFGPVYAEWTVLDPGRFPPDVLIGRLDTKGDHYPQTLIREDLATKLVRAKFTGPQLNEVWHSRDRGAPAAKWKPGGGQVIRKPPNGPWPGYFK